MVPVLCRSFSLIAGLLLLHHAAAAPPIIEVVSQRRYLSGYLTLVINSGGVVYPLFGVPTYEATVFVPTNTAVDAFIASLKVADMAELVELMDKSPDFKDLILKVIETSTIPGKAHFSSDLRDKAQLMPITGEGLQVGVTSGGLEVGIKGEPDLATRVVEADVRAGAAALHVVDKVLCPAQLHEKLRYLVHSHGVLPRMHEWGGDWRGEVL